MSFVYRQRMILSVGPFPPFLASTRTCLIRPASGEGGCVGFVNSISRCTSPLPCLFCHSSLFRTFLPPFLLFFYFSFPRVCPPPLTSSLLPTWLPRSWRKVDTPRVPQHLAYTPLLPMFRLSLSTAAVGVI